MKILSIKSLAIPEIKVIRYRRHMDNRGYFAEVLRKSDIDAHSELSFLKNETFNQFNESFSKQSTIRGLHVQWSPFQGKLVRTLMGHMTDLILDIRKNSRSFGKIIAYDLPVNNTDDFGEFIWVPVGFAHGGFYPQESKIEYYCTSNWSQDSEAGISPLAPDIDWSLCDVDLKAKFDELVNGTPLISDKDKNGFTVAQWSQNPNAGQFLYEGAV